jgi:N6-L-threonylcarbamoyladenine synthase
MRRSGNVEQREQATRTGGRDRLTRVLGIETSCDETAAAVVALLPDGSATIQSSVVFSQIGEHAAFGGVVPEIAARAHVEALDGVIEAALLDAGTDLDAVDAIAATAGPGLIGGLIVGLTTAKALAAVSGKPLLAINHLEGHALTARLTDGLAFPYLLLLVSGGHTQILLVRGVGAYERWATTIDDALGEAFDKTAKLLGLPYPGGPSVEKEARKGDPRGFDFPRPLRGEARPDFSFSGLKTAVRQAATGLQPLTATDIADICASFQQAVVDTLEERVGRSLSRFREAFAKVPRPSLVVAGGVAANAAIRTKLQELCRQNGFDFVAPPLNLCTDNAAMIAWAGLERLRADPAAPEDGMKAVPRSRWPLDEAAAPAIGAGKRGAKA